MDDEFALCWNNFQDNIATGFQNLYDRGDLVDVTLACDGKLLQAHKIVLAICSPYFQEMFITNPCKHPIIILKDVTYTVMAELLQFMYQGVVNVKHTELPSFMKIAQNLQIKGLATSSQKSPSQIASGANSTKSSGNNNHPENQNNNNSNNSTSDTKLNSSNNKISDSIASSSGVVKRVNELNSDSLSILPKKHYKRFSESTDHDLNDSIEHINSEDVFLPPIPQISMVESRFDLNNVKREIGDLPASPGGMRNSLPPPFNFEYGGYPSKHIEYPNELHISEYPKGAGNHMDVPSGSNITMLSSTSLLHGNCIFNRNNTVATQQGMKTYWLCKSYRITMCRARCITHQGRVISATGVHNHQPHMKSPANNELLTPIINQPTHSNMQTSTGNSMPSNSNNSIQGAGGNMRIPQQNSNIPQHHFGGQQHQQHVPSHHHPPQQLQPPTHHQLHHTPPMQGHHQHPSNNAVIQNMMQNVLTQNNLMHLSNMAPMLNSLPQHSSQLNNQPPSNLQVTPIVNSPVNMNSPNSRSSNQAHSQLDSPNMHPVSMESPSHTNSNSNSNVNSNMPVVTSSSIAPVSSSSPVEENCASLSQDSNNSSQSNIISSITISPTQPSFKMEHI